MTDPDGACVERLRRGDESALVDLMTRYKRPMLDFAFRMLNDAAEAEEVAQDVFVRAYQHIARFRPRALFSTWLFQIARNAALDRLRRRARRGIFQSLENDSEKVPVSGKNPSENFQTLEVGAEIAAALAALPEDQRSALVLAEYEDLSVRQIAAIQRCSEKAVENRLYRARQTLRERLAHLLDK